jgi:hypothetical protein
MVAAAKADGHVDEVERTRIFAGIAGLGLQDTAVELLPAEIDAAVYPAVAETYPWCSGCYRRSQRGVFRVHSRCLAERI